jgi:integrase
VSEADFRKLLDAADDWLKPILIIAYDTGMRKAEILNLTWDRVDLEGRRIVLRADDTKGNQARFIYLTERAYAALGELAPGQTRKVFGLEPNRKRRRRRGHGFRNAFDRSKEAAGLPHIWFHDLRRSFVTNARKRGVPESVVMKMSGHRTRSVFARYNIIDDADLRDAVKRIELGQATT